MSKPSWKDSPEWAQYLAMDSSGAWFWYENKPMCGCDSWVSKGRLEYHGYSVDWEDSLEQRPCE